MAAPRFNELTELAVDHDGLFTASEAREAGFEPSVLARLTQRGRLERMARGVYRIPFIPLNRFSQYREAVLWAQAHRGPVDIALSHETALSVYGISDANPDRIQLTVPGAARLRRETPKAVKLHRHDLDAGDITIYEGLPVTTIARTVSDLLESGGRLDFIQQAIAQAVQEGFTSATEARGLRALVARRRRKASGHRQSDR